MYRLGADRIGWLPYCDTQGIKVSWLDPFGGIHPLFERAAHCKREAGTSNNRTNLGSRGSIKCSGSNRGQGDLIIRR